MWTSSRPRTGIRVDGQSIELVDDFCYLAVCWSTATRKVLNKDALVPSLHSAPSQNACGHHQWSQSASIRIRSSLYHDMRIRDLGSTVYDGGEA
ncbi:hypothetical protein RB195_023531 [Necator americanus]|uniref:Uncharacterized protein n=1 Tax=Necator americanus TaxID=51031 RepID=A0ABR1EJK6_NECAM